MSNLYIPDPYGYDCGKSRVSFDCSREAVEQLQLTLDLWKLSRDSENSLRNYLCSREMGSCSYSVIDSFNWVQELNLNTSDPEQAEVKSYLECVV